MPSLTKPSTDRVIQVGVPVPGLDLLSYGVPAELPRPAKGARVVVPLGARTVTGCVVDDAAAVPAGTRLKDVIRVLDSEPFLPPVVVDLALWVAEYYLAGPGEALAAAMPPASRGERSSAFRTERIAELVAGVDAGAIKGPKQRAVLSALEGRAEGLSLAELEQQGYGASAVRALVRAGLVAWRERVVQRDPFAAPGGAAGLWSIEPAPLAARQLTDEQATAIDQLDAASAGGQFRTALLQGVTGSGKTEVYLQLAGKVLARGRRVLVLVPEIGLTPAVAGLFRARFGSRVAIQHSGLSDG